MEAATPLRPPLVRRVGDRLVVDALVLDDPCLLRLVEEREGAGEDPVRLVTDAVEIGARVLDREQGEVHADYVRAEFERMAEGLEGRLDEVFGPESGHLSRALRRHFSDESSVAVQHRVREMMAEVMGRQREDFLRLISSSEGHNPFADFKRGMVTALRQGDERQERRLGTMAEQMTALQLEVQGLRAEREKRDELAEERERGTAKGRTFEEQVAAAVDALAAVQGDDCDAVGDRLGAGGKTGDVVVSVEGCRGPALGRIVFEAKTARLSRPQALKELARAKVERDADFAVLVVPGEERLPARMRPLREIEGDKLIVTYDPEGDGRLSLEVGYALARARVLMARSEAEGVDTGAVRERVERALGSLEDVRRVRSQLTGAKSRIDEADAIVAGLAERVREHLRDIERIVRAGEGAPPER